VPAGTVCISTDGVRGVRSAGGVRSGLASLAEFAALAGGGAGSLAVSETDGAAGAGALGRGAVRGFAGAGPGVGAGAEAGAGASVAAGVSDGARVGSLACCVVALSEELSRAQSGSIPTNSKSQDKRIRLFIGSPLYKRHGTALLWTPPLSSLLSQTDLNQFSLFEVLPDCRQELARDLVHLHIGSPSRAAGGCSGTDLLFE
jgi:hypothetical protein